jgi:hypothetical protein
MTTDKSKRIFEWIHEETVVISVDGQLQEIILTND